jgi:energy-coupling factor transporter ATP-binding protein EcfA2
MALASMKEHRQWLLARDFHQLRWHGSLSAGSATVSDLLARQHVERSNPFAVLDEWGQQRFEQARRREIARLELGPLLERPVVALSNGELHRFVLARALLRQPRLLFIDDPMAGLDRRCCEHLFETLDQLDRESIGVVLAAERERDLPSGLTHGVRLEAGDISQKSAQGDAVLRVAAATSSITGHWRWSELRPLGMPYHSVGPSGARATSPIVKARCWSTKESERRIVSRPRAQANPEKVATPRRGRGAQAG